MFSLWMAVTVGQAGAPVPPPAPGFSEETVAKVIESHRGEVEACLGQAIAERTAKKKKLGEGPVVVRFVLDPKWKVRDASFKRSVTKSVEFQACLLKQVKSWVFPKPGDKKLHPIEYPFDVRVIR